MRFWSTDRTYNHFFNKLGYSANFGFTEFKEVVRREEQEGADE
jgi:hypothetical protein